MSNIKQADFKTLVTGDLVLTSVALHNGRYSQVSIGAVGEVNFDGGTLLIQRQVAGAISQTFYRQKFWCQLPIDAFGGRCPTHWIHPTVKEPRSKTTGKGSPGGG